MKTSRKAKAEHPIKLNPLVKFSVSRYVLATGIFIALVAFGIISTFSLGVDLLPSIRIPAVTVVTTYTGASPSVVDQQVTQIIEDAVSTLSGITDINSNSSLGSSRVTVMFDTDVDTSAAANQTASVVNAATRKLPTGIQAPVVRTFDPNSQPVIQFGVAGGGRPLFEVSTWVSDVLAPALERVPGVANLTIDGAPARQFQVLLDPNRMRYYNLNPAQVVAAVNATAINQPIGSIVTQGSSLTFSTTNIPSGVEGLRRTLVDAARGIAVGDLGTVKDASADTNYARIDGLPMVVVSVQRTSESNAVAVVDGTKKALAAMNMPAGYSVVLSNDTTGSIRASIGSTLKELFMTLFVVALIILLFLGKPSTAFVVILAVPIALSASPVLYKLAGFSFNLVSLLALVIAIGIVVDDSIVVAENVERHRLMGESRRDAVLKGASEVFSAVVAASLSLLSVLLPVSFIGGFIGRYLTQFALGLAAAVAFSLLEAVLFLTVRLAYTPDSKTGSFQDFRASLARLGPRVVHWMGLYKRIPYYIFAVLAAGLLYKLKKTQFIPIIAFIPLAIAVLDYLAFLLLRLLEAVSRVLNGGTEWVVEHVRDAYTGLLPAVLRRAGWVLGLTSAVLVAVAVVLVPRIPFSFVPQSDNGSLTVGIRFPPGTSQDTVNRAALIAESFVIGQSEVKTVQSIVGSSAQITVLLTPVGTRPTVFAIAQDYRKRLSGAVQKSFPNARVSVGTGGFGGGGSDLQLSLVSADLDELQRRNSAILKAVQEDPKIADATSSLSDVNMENAFLPDPDAIRGTGLTTQAIAAALQTYTTGTQASNVVIGGQAFPIMVQADPSALSGSQNLLDLPVYSTALAASYQAGQLGRFQLSQAPVSLSRYNRQYQGTLSINLKPGSPTVLEMQNALQADLTERGLVDGEVRLVASSRFGQAALSAELAKSGPLIFLFALFLAYLVMAAQFNSWRYPLYLLLPVPLALVGALLFVYFVGGGIDIFGLMGFLMLIGLSAKNAILYLDFVVDRLDKMPFVDALVDAGRLRFRPIVMTTLTVLVISFPLMLGGGQGAEFGQRMGVVMLGGILFSAVLTFFMVPAAFFFFERKRHKDPEPGVLPAEAPEQEAAGD